jgi:hypothetical protein
MVDDLKGTPSHSLRRPVTVQSTPSLPSLGVGYSENDKKERSLVTGHFTDVLVKDGGRWQFIAWAEPIGRAARPSASSP